MKIDLSKYLNNLPVVKNYVLANPKMSISDKVTNLSIATYMPLIVCAYYIGKVEGYSSELDLKIQTLKQFYKYDEIVGLDQLIGDDHV